MKYTIVLIIILFPVLLKAQTNADSLINSKDFVYKDSLVKKVLRELKENWTLGIDSTSEAVDLRMYNKFKSLFDSSAAIDDEFNAFYKYSFDTGKETIKGTYQINTASKPYDEYAHDVALQVRKLTADTNKVKVLSEKFSSDSNTVTVILKRVVKADKIRQYVLDSGYASDLLHSRNKIIFNGKNKDSELNDKLISAIKKSKDSVYHFESRDSLRITLFYDSSSDENEDDEATYKILRIERLSDSVFCTNDDDKDAVLNAEDADSTEAGDFTAGGLPDYDLDGEDDKKDACMYIFGNSLNQGCPVEGYFASNKQWDAFIGLQFNSAKINLPQLNQLGYKDEAGNDAMDVLQSQKGVVKNPAAVAGLTVGGNFSYFFGQTKRKTGISVGIAYSTFNADYQLTSPIVYTFKSSDGIDFYRRQITIDSLKETINYSVFNLPVMLNYRMHLDKKNKSSITLKAGPSLMLLNAKSNYNTYISFGGLYQTNSTGIDYRPLFEKNDNTNIFITADSINVQSSVPGADQIFNQLRANSNAYDFAGNKNYQGKQKNTMRATVAFNVALDLQKQISKNSNWAFKFGVHFLYAPLPERKDKYKPIDKTTDPYQSIYNSSAKSSYSAYGINIGFVHKF